MSGISLRIDVKSDADIYEVVFDMCRMANILNANITSTIKGVYFSVGPNRSPKKEYKRLMAEIEFLTERMNTNR